MDHQACTAVVAVNVAQSLSTISHKWCCSESVLGPIPVLVDGKLNICQRGLAMTKAACTLGYICSIRESDYTPLPGTNHSTMSGLGSCNAKEQREWDEKAATEMVSRAAAHNLCRKGRQQVFFWKREGYGGGIQLLSFTTEGVIVYRQDGSRLPSEVHKQGVRGSGPRLLQG